MYRYSFSEDTAFEQVQSTLLLALWATESIHGDAAVRLDAAHSTDDERRLIEIDGTTPTGLTLNKLLVGFLVREFGPLGFRVERHPDLVPL
jgi:hypothetical protein